MNENQAPAPKNHKGLNLERKIRINFGHCDLLINLKQMKYFILKAVRACDIRKKRPPFV